MSIDVLFAWITKASPAAKEIIDVVAGPVKEKVGDTVAKAYMQDIVVNGVMKTPAMSNKQ